MKNTSRYIIIILIFLASGLKAQSGLNISGLWSGPVNVPLSEDLLGEYFFEQNGLIVKGYAKLKTLDGKDSTKYAFNGSIKDGVIMFKGTEFEYKASGACMSNTELQLDTGDGQVRLVGKWYGDFSFSTCPPGVSGKIELARIENPITEPVSTWDQESVIVEESDVVGNALIKELGIRKYYALIIGTDDYEDDGITDLDNPVKDARELVGVLEGYYTFDSENIVFLANPTRTEIIESFDALSEKITDRDQLLIFYAGHGIWDERLNQGFWLPSNASLDSKAQWLSNSTIRDYIGGIKSKHTLLITDACFSGSIFKERAVSFDNSRAILEMYKLPSRKAMTSGALKTVPDKSVFITYLLKNLINNEQPLLSAEDLFRVFKIAVIN
ncbi:MAG: caspase family protein, partial [Saprospiraceae bacterium]|nr:caspase family protein [Saprospiraceae bacterium]